MAVLTIAVWGASLTLRETQKRPDVQAVTGATLWPGLGWRLPCSARITAAEPWLTRKQSRGLNVTAAVTATQ
jgi:hypothetical protein